MPLYTAFVADAAAYDRAIDHPDSLRMVFVGNQDDLIDGEVGYCSQSWVDRKFSGIHLEINTVELERSLLKDPTSLRRATYHELGHCLLRLEHADATTPDAIMTEEFSVGFDLGDSVWSQLVKDLMQTY